MKYQRGSIMFGMGITIGLLSLALALTGWLYNGALKEKARIEGEYTAFKEGVRKIGEKAETDKKTELVRQAKEKQRAEKSYNDRLTASNARADSLCKSAGLSSGCRELPAIPDTTRPVDDGTRDQRLLEVLRHAQKQTDQLIELQENIRQQVVK